MEDSWKSSASHLNHQLLAWSKLRKEKVILLYSTSHMDLNKPFCLITRGDLLSLALCKLKLFIILSN